MHIARIEAPPQLTAPRGAHFIAGTVEVVTVDEVDRAVTDHFLRQVSQYGLGAWADLDQKALGIGDQDQILGGFEDAAPFFDLLAECLLGSPALGDVAGNLGYPDDRSGRGFDRRYAE